MEWNPLPKNGNLARQLIKDQQRSRDTIKTIVSPDKGHAVVAWIDVPRRWHYYCLDEDSKWQLVDTYMTSTVARKRAEKDIKMSAIEKGELGPIPEGAAVIRAKFTRGRQMVVTSSSPRITEDISGIFQRLGCHVEVSET